MSSARQQTLVRAVPVPVGDPREVLLAQLEAVNVLFDRIARAAVSGVPYCRDELVAVMQRRNQLQERLAQVAADREVGR
jgi:hypothetical protein